MTTTVVLSVLEFLFTISLVLVIFKAKVVALIGWVSLTIISSLKGLSNFKACLN
jgi:hypothetical protein